MKSLGACLKLIVADQHGGKSPSRPPSLEVVSQARRIRYVNIDTCSPSGIQTAKTLGFAETQPAQVVYSPFIRDAIENLFDDQHPAEIFALFRHPVDRAVSLFYYLQHATWESTYNPAFQNMTLAEFAVSHADDNYLTRMLTGNHGVLTPDDLIYAKTFLSERIVVGLTDRMDDSVQRFGRVFRWTKNRKWKYCRLRAKQGKNRFPHPKLQEGDAEWNLLAAKNVYDIELYEHAKELFERQGAIV